MPDSRPEAAPPAAGLADRLRTGEVAALARALSLMDGGGEGARRLLHAVRPDARCAAVVGFTGPPGAGKSTLINAFIRRQRALGRTVAALAVDPSSPKGGGAILGDRARMGEHVADPGVFIRSLAARGHLGGLTLNIHALVDVVDAAGWDVILLETVGTGQSEVEVARVADATVVISAPGLGDDVQAIKAGVLEIADVLAVNKADLPGATVTAQQLSAMLTLRPDDSREVPVIRTTATTGGGIEALADAVDAVCARVTADSRTARAQAHAAEMIAQAAARRLRAELLGPHQALLRELTGQLLAGEIDADEAACEAALACTGMGSGPAPSKRKAL